MGHEQNVPHEEGGQEDQEDARPDLVGDQGEEEGSYARGTG